MLLYNDNFSNLKALFQGEIAVIKRAKCVGLLSESLVGSGGDMPVGEDIARIPEA